MELTELAGLALASQPRTDRWPQSAACSCLQPAGAEQHRRFFRDLLQLASLDDLEGKRVLDVGSGFGMGLIESVLLGASEAHGVEYVPEAVEAVARYLPSLPADLRDRINNRAGDAADLPYPPRSFDVLLSIEAISHYLDPQAFLSEAARVLRPGGVLLISDGNNASNRKIRRELRQVWRAFEEGTPGTRVGEHTVGRSYRAMRRDAITTAYPDLSADVAERIARNTAGWTSDRTVEAAAGFLQDGTLPDDPYREGQLAIAPSGMAMERGFDPFALAREIATYGFSASAYGYWGGAAGRPHVRAANWVLMGLSRWTMPLARAFRIVATRR